MLFRWSNGVLEYWLIKAVEIIFSVPPRLPAPRSPNNCNAGRHGNCGQVNPSLQYSTAPTLPGPDLANGLCASILRCAPGQANWDKAPKYTLFHNIIADNE